LEKKKNIDYRFKILYAIGMILVVNGHAYGGISILEDWFHFNGSHLALFTFSSGYFYKSSSEKSVNKYVLKKIKTLIIPLYIYNIIYGLIVLASRAKGFAIGGDFTPYNIFVAPITNGHQFGYNLGGWYIIPLFMVEIFNVLFRKLLNKLHNNISEWFFFITSLLLGITGNQLACIGYYNDLWLVLVRMLYFVPFYALGILYKKKLEQIDRKIPSFYYFSFVFAAKLVVIYLCGKSPAYVPSWCKNFNNGPIMPIIVGFLGIALWLRIAIILTPAIGKSKWVNIIADNTYSIMINQFLGFMIVKTLYAILYKYNIAFSNFDWNSYKTSLFWFYEPRHLKQTLIMYTVFGLTIPIILQKIINNLKKAFTLCHKHKLKKKSTDLVLETDITNK